MGDDLYSAFSESCLRHGDRMLVCEARGSSYIKKTYCRILDEVHSLIAYLGQFSLNPGDKIALLSENRHEWLVAYLASTALGCVAVPLDPKLKAPDWKKQIGHSESKLLFVSDKIPHQDREILSEILPEKQWIVFDSEKIPNPPCPLLSSIIGRDKEGELPPSFPPYRGEEVASLIYTSGTTGESKGVLLTHQNLIQSALNMRRGPDEPGKLLALILPLHHIYGFIVCLCKTLSGGSVLLYPKIDLQIILKSFQDLCPRAISGVPTFYERMGHQIKEQLSREIPPWVRTYLRAPAYKLLGAQASALQGMKRLFFKKVHRILGGQVEYLSSGGAPLDMQTARLFNLMGLPILEGYGLTETSAVVAINDTGTQNYRMGSVGKPCNGIEIKLERTSPTEDGEICVKSPCLMKGYFKDPEASRKALDAEGYFHTGDLGHIDSAGFLHITGRLKDLIVTSAGKKISPIEVEEHFKGLSAIKELCVFGLPQGEGKKAELVHLQILPEEGVIGSADRGKMADKIREEVRRASHTLPEYKRPQSVGFSRDPFPRTTTLKIKRNEVREAFLRNLDNKTPSSRREMEKAFETPEGQLVWNTLQDILPKNLPIRTASSLALDLGLDSLGLTDFWSRLEHKLGTTFPDNETLPLQEVGAVIDYLAKSPKRWKIPPEEKEISQATLETLRSFPRLRPRFLDGFRAFFKRFSHLEIRGIEKLPPKGPYVLAPNHESHLDNLFIACFLPRPIQQDMVILGKKEHFENPVTRFFARLCHAIPVNRGMVSRSVLQICGQILREGKVLLIHPEGTRSSDGHLLPFKDGVAFLSFYFQCPIIPVYIEGAHEFWPKDAKFPRSRSRITVTILDPLYPSPLSHQSPQPPQASIHRLTERLRDRLGNFSGEWEGHEERKGA